MAEKPLVRRYLLSRQLMTRRSLALVARAFSLIDSVRRRHRPLANPRPKMALVQRSPVVPMPLSPRPQGSWRQSQMVWLGRPLPYERGDVDLPMPAPVRIPSTSVEPTSQVARRVSEIPVPPAQFSPRAVPRVAVQAAPQPSPTVTPPPVEQTPEPAGGGLVRGSDLWQRLFPERPSFLQSVREKELARKRETSQKRPPPVIPSKLPRTRTWEITPGDLSTPSTPVEQAPPAGEAISREAEEVLDSPEYEDESPPKPARAGPPDQTPPPLQRLSSVPQKRGREPQAAPSPRPQRDLDRLRVESDDHPSGPAEAGEVRDLGGREIALSPDPEAKAKRPALAEAVTPKAPVAQDVQTTPVSRVDAVGSAPVEKVIAEDGAVPESALSSPAETVTVAPAEIQTKPERPGAQLPSRGQAPVPPETRETQTAVELPAAPVGKKAAPAEPVVSSRGEALGLPAERPASEAEIQAASPEPGATRLSLVEEDQPAARSKRLPAETERGPSELAALADSEVVRKEEAPAPEVSGLPAPPMTRPSAPAVTRSPTAAVQPRSEVSLAPEEPTTHSQVEVPAVKPTEAPPDLETTKSQVEMVSPRRSRAKRRVPDVQAKAVPDAKVAPADITSPESVEPVTISAPVDRTVEPRSDAPHEDVTTVLPERPASVEPAPPLPSVVSRQPEPTVRRPEAKTVDLASLKRAETPAETAVERQRVRVSPAVESPPPRRESTVLQVQAKQTEQPTPPSELGENGKVRVQAEPVIPGTPTAARPGMEHPPQPMTLPLRPKAGAAEPGRPLGETAVARSPLIAREAAMPGAAARAWQPPGATAAPMPLHVPATLQRVDTPRLSSTSQARTLPVQEPDVTQVEETPSPDMDKDKLAREVYEVLKRRLIAEREQFWGY
jgi:hypothetical protein